MTRIKRVSLVLLVVPLFSVFLLNSSCAKRQDALREDAKFLLDRCNPTQESSLPNCTAAVTKANELQQIDPGDLDAAMLEASAELGLARFDFLSFLSDLSELQDSGADDFGRFRGFILDYEQALNTNQSLTGLEIVLAEMATAVDVFDGLFDDAAFDADGVATDETTRRAFFQLGLIQALDAFIRPVKLASGGVANVANITDAQATRIQADFINADNNILRGGGDESEIDDVLRPIRENYCRCSLQTPLGGQAGFNLTCLRDLMRCELYDGNGIEQDYNDNGDVAVGDCDTLLDPPGLEACGGTNTL